MHRTEASDIVSEFNLTEVGKEKVKLDDLIKTLKKTTTHSKVKKQLKNASRQKTLPVPLSKPQAEKIKRTIAYEKASEEVGKWDSIVRTNRSAEQVIYPLKKPEFHLETTEEVAKRFRTKNALEEEVSKLLNKSENVLDQNKMLTEAEEKALKAMSLAEARARHGELRKMRELLSFKEARARRQKKIKSKKYHQLLKKDKMKKLMKEFEELQKTDPEAAEEKIRETDKLRILERMTLKHRSTGKWAKQQKIRAKYNIESRSALKEQLSLGRQLTEKVIPTGKNHNDSEDEFSHIEVLADNVESAHQEEEDDELLNMYRLNYEGHDPEDQLKESSSKMESISALNDRIKAKKSTLRSTVDEEEEDAEEAIEESLERRQTLEDFDNLTESEWLTPSYNVSIDDQLQKNDEPVEDSTHKSKATLNNKVVANYVSETDFTAETKILDSMVPDNMTYGDEGIDDVQEDRMNITQAFADEDFIAEFKEDKKATEEKEQPGGIDLFLPGWGSWGGAGIKNSKRKRRRFYIQPDIQSRKDSTLGNVIISQEKDSKASVHQISDVPFPFKSVHSFESMIRQPIGSTWNPETSFHKLIAPKVVTKRGKIIDPMDKEDLVLQTDMTSEHNDSQNKQESEAQENKRKHFSKKNDRKKRKK